MKCNVGGFTIENIEDAHKFLKLMQEEDFNYYFNNFKLTNPKLEKAEDGSYYISMVMMAAMNLTERHLSH